MEIGILDIKGSLPCFENFGNLPTKIIDENSIKEIKDLNMLIIPGGSLIESKSLNDDLKRYITEFDGYIIGICSGFQVLSEKIDIGRKSPIPIVKEGLSLLNVEFSPLICTDRVESRLENDSIFGNAGELGHGFHCHTYGDIKIKDEKTKILTTSKIKKLNYKMVGEKEIISGVFCKNVYGTMVHGLLDNINIKENILKSLKVDENEREEIYKKNKEIVEKLKSKRLFKDGAPDEHDKCSKYNSSESGKNAKKGMVLLATGSESGKTFLTTGLVSKLPGKTFVAKIGPDVRDIVPALYILREPMTEYSSIKIADRGWCNVDDFLKFVKNSDYNYYIVEGVMGAFTGALNKRNYSGAEISKLLNFPVYIVSSCSKSGIEGAFVESLGYYSLLKEMGVNVEGIILNRVYNFDIFEKVKRIGDELGVKVIGIRKAENSKSEKRGLIPEVEIDYEEFCRLTNKLNIQLEIPKLEFNDVKKEYKSFEDHLKNWSKKIKDIN